MDQVLYQWSTRGQLTGADVTGSSGISHVSYGYDADGNRVSRTVNGVETRSLVDTSVPFPRVVAGVREPGGNALVSYVFGNGPISQTQGEEQASTLPTPLAPSVP